MSPQDPLSLSPVFPDHGETDLGWVAAVTDVGLRHQRNEDAYAIAAGNDIAAVVVCDGVSSSANPHRASAAAALGAADTMAPALAKPWPGEDGGGRLLKLAFAVAQAAVGRVEQSEPGGYPAPPSTTIVAALVSQREILIASAGDSRAYWLDPGSRSGLRLTADDSLAEEAIAMGVPPAEAYSSPNAHVITRWLDGDSAEDEPELRVFRVSEPGILLVCTDGLWNYFEPPHDLATLVAGAGGHLGDAAPIDIARHLVTRAVEAGGSDNITVAVARLGG